MAAPSATQDEMQVPSHWLRHDGRQRVAASVGGASYEPRRRRRTASCCLTAYTPKQGHIADARGVILVLPLRFDGVDQEVKWGSSLGDGSWGFAGTLQTVWTWLFWLLWDVVLRLLPVGADARSKIFGTAPRRHRLCTRSPRRPT